MELHVGERERRKATTTLLSKRAFLESRDTCYTNDYNDNEWVSYEGGANGMGTRKRRFDVLFSKLN